jgi:hypothetical protein
MKRIEYGAVVSLATVALLLLPALASAWAPAGSAPVHPGVQTYSLVGAILGA